MKNRILFVMLVLSLLLLSACQMVQPMADEGEMMMEPEPGKITVMNVRARPSPMAGGNGAVFMVVLNGLDEDVQFISAESPASTAVELHETVNDGGVMRMVHQPDGYPIAAGGSVELKPGGKHVMLIDLVEQLETGNELELTINFSNGESQTVTVPVADMKGEMPMDMEGMEMDDDMEHGEGEDKDMDGEEKGGEGSGG
jgi:copper(I)-binding protein